MNDRMSTAYRAAERLVDAQLSEEEKTQLRDADETGIVVIRGQYDRVEDVLGAMRIPHKVVDPTGFRSAHLSPDALLVINCPGQLDRSAIQRVREFVEQGGSLFSTDWALLHVVEPAFPGTVEFNKQPTDDTTVRVEVRDHDNPFLDGMFHPGADPIWWLDVLPTHVVYTREAGTMPPMPSCGRR